MKIKELFSDPSKWTQHFYARNETKHGVGPIESDAVCWCLIGAIYKCYPEGQRVNIMNMIYAKVNTITNFNDTHSFEEIKALVEELDI